MMETVPEPDSHNHAPELEPEQYTGRKRGRKPKPADSNTVKAVRAVKDLIDAIGGDALTAILPFIGDLTSAIDQAGGNEEFAALVEILK